MNNIPAHPADEAAVRSLVDWLVRYRITLGLSQREVGRRMAAGATTVHYIEVHAKSQSVSSLQAYCRALGGELSVGFVMKTGGEA